MVNAPTHERFVVLPKRWVGERTFGWFANYRILSKNTSELTNRPSGYFSRNDIIDAQTLDDPCRRTQGAPKILINTLSGQDKSNQQRLPGSLRSYLAIVALFALGNSSDAFLLLRARDLGVSVASLPVLWTVFHVAKLVSSYIGGDWSDRIARPKLIVSGWVLYAMTYLAFGVATRNWHAWALFIVYGIYYGLTEPAEKALVKELAPPAVRGRAYGMYNFIMGASAVPAGVLTGWLWQTWSPLVALATGAAIATASSMALIVWSSSSDRLPANE
ncbi:MAG: MFS transporter [Polyangiaceae bacterium]|nr:MFS transporter [Polyangiaceae bacterium]